MIIFFSLIQLLALFAILGLSADIAVKNIKYISTVLKIRLFAFGIILALITTLPELSVGINAVIDEAPSLFVGNLFGGVIVLLGLILGTSLIFNRKIKTDGKLKIIIPQILVIFSPVLLGLDGKFTFIDSLIMIGLYLGLISYLYRTNHAFNGIHFEFLDQKKIIKAILFSIAGIIFVLLSAHFVVKITLGLLENINISQLAVGILLFSIGTNLPEITIAITSWKKRSPELSLSHLLSSAFTYVLVFGILSFLKPLSFDLNLTYWTVCFFLFLILFLFTIFYYSGKKMDRLEGFVLLGVYVAFIIVNFFILKSA